MSQQHGIPKYGLKYFDHLRGESQAVVSSVPDAQDKDFFRQIESKREDGSLTWEDIYAYELRLLDYLSVEELKAKIRGLRGKYSKVASKEENDAYLASNPPDPAASSDEAALRADLKYLLSEFYLYYSLLATHEGLRDRLLKVTATLTAVFFLLTAAITYYVITSQGDGRPGLSNAFTVILLVIFAGMAGAFLSMQQRIQAATIQGSPLYNLSMLTHGWFGIFLSPISGAVFAVVLYLFFVGGLVTGKIFPEIRTNKPLLVNITASVTPSSANTPPTNQTSAPAAATMATPASVTSTPTVDTPTVSPTPTPLQTPNPTTIPSRTTTAVSTPTTQTQTQTPPVSLNAFLRSTGPASGVDYALLIIWSFIAGFAERFVPDKLNKIIATNEANQNKA